MLWDRWTLDAQGGIDDYERLAGREFYYDGLGERFLTRDLDVTHAAPEYWTPVNPWDWTDTVGLDPWADFGATITEPPSGPWTATTFELRRYLPGVAEQDLGPPSEPIVYRHGDLLDSTMLLTDETGSGTATLEVCWRVAVRPMCTSP